MLTFRIATVGLENHGNGSPPVALIVADLAPDLTCSRWPGGTKCRLVPIETIDRINFQTIVAFNFPLMQTDVVQEISKVDVNKVAPAKKSALR
jgi:hypothetical protein